MTTDDGLVGHWKLERDCDDSSRPGNHGTNHGVTFSDGSAQFDGRRGFIEVPVAPSFRVGRSDFTLAAWVHTAEVLDDIIGDVASMFDPARRCGFTLSVDNRAGVTSSQCNWRNLSFASTTGGSTSRSPTAAGRATP